MTIAEDVPTRELPYWMRQAQRGVDWGVLLVIAFSLALAWPFLLQPGLPHTNASENYVYRTADYAQAIMEGRLYPRWSPHALSGYGAPIPHYYPPGAAYSAALVQVLFTGDATTAVRIVYAAALCLCGSMMYVFVTRRAGSSAGVLASVLYVSSPYVGMTIPHILGDLPGAIALALLPTLLWAVDRLLILNRPHDITLVAFTVAALVLTSPRDGAISLALAALLVVWHVWANDRHASWHLVVAGAALGIGMASFFWLPALLEQNAVQWRPADRPSDDQLSVKTLFAPLQLIDLAEMKPLPQLSVGLVGIGSALFGLLGALQARRQSAFQILFLIAGLGLIVLGLTAFTGEVWLLGPISLCLAISGSAVLQLGRYATASVQRLLLPASLI
ncbi:MAG: 6-pyruvoyl-tetrahydropterin synthase-related protein, partial [candidate division KSB1 bacterium]|nr:6-pyruvoyl-tetrahydropterin synthase-related protein [candidate division KSB1 bacterium]